MRIRALACAAFALVLTGASEPIRLQPFSQWAVDYAEDSCRLVRTFGQGAQQTKVVLESIAPDDLTMLVVGRPVPAQIGPFGGDQIYARFVPGQDDWIPGNSAEAEQGAPAALWPHVPLMPVKKVDGKLSPELQKALDEAKARAKSGERPAPIDLNRRASERAERMKFAANIAELDIQPAHGNVLVLETGPLSDPLKVFDLCTRDLVSSWGIDPDVQDKIVRPAWTRDITAWFSSGDYPSDAIRLGQESQVTFRLLIDATGKVTRCTALSPYDAPLFKIAVCNALKQRAKFSPAELSDGTKVPSYYTNRVVFRLGY